MLFLTYQNKALILRTIPNIAIVTDTLKSLHAFLFSSTNWVLYLLVSGDILRDNIANFCQLFLSSCW